MTKATNGSSIWRRPVTVEAMNRLSRGTMIEHVGIVFTRIGDDFAEATMPVDARTRQPFGVLHGGASVVLAETLGSSAANWCVDAEQFVCVGLEINANHVRSVSEGVVTGIARPLHLGRRTQVWDIRIRDARDRLVCTSRLTMAVVEKE